MGTNMRVVLGIFRSHKHIASFVSFTSEMMRILTPLILLVSFQLSAQTWEMDWVRQLKCEDDLYGFNLSIDSDNKMYIGGTFEDGKLDADPSGIYYNHDPIGRRDIWVSKLDSFGFREWSFVLGGIYDDELVDLRVDGDDNLIITGFVTRDIDFDPSSAYKIVEGDGRYAYVAKYSPSGALIWVHVIRGNNSVYGTHVQVDENNNIYVAGYTPFNSLLFDYGDSLRYYNNLNQENFFLMKLDPKGQLLWERVFGGEVDDPSIDRVSDMHVTSKGDIYTIAAISSAFDLDHGPGVAIPSEDRGMQILMKHNTHGDFQWFRHTKGYQGFRAVTSDEHGNIYLAGSMNDSASFDNGASLYSVLNEGSAGYIARFTSDASLLWVKTFPCQNWMDISRLGVDDERLAFYGRYSNHVDCDPGPAVHSIPRHFNSFPMGSVLGFLDLDGAFIDAYDMGGFAHDFDFDSKKGVVCTGVFDTREDFDPSIDSFMVQSSSYWDGFMVRMDYQEPTGIAEVKAGEVSVYPNPTSGVLNYTCSGTDQLEMYEVYDSAGKRLLSEKTNVNSGQIDLKLNSGLYFIRWKFSDGSVKHSRIVLEN